jgi:hypothetical protein
MHPDDSSPQKVMSEEASGETTIFVETQRCTWWFLWLILILCDTIAVTSAIADKVFDVQIGNVPPNDAAYAVSFVILILMTVPSMLLKLTTRITDAAIYVRLSPPPLGMMHDNRFAWKGIAKAYVRDYREMKEYGGFGIRFGLNNSEAISMNGKVGLQLELIGGRKVLISTRKPEELSAALLGLQEKGLAVPFQTTM